VSGFVKIYGSILDSTVWETPQPTRLVWITMLVMANRDGIVEASIPGLARRAGVTIEECEAALETLSAPDKYSRTKTDDGRRIREIDGGWVVITHAKYRAIQSPDAERVARNRANKQPNICSDVRPDTDPEIQIADPDPPPVLTNPDPSPPPKKSKRGKAREDFPDELDSFLLAEINAAREHIGKAKLRTVTPTAGMRDSLRKLYAAERPDHDTISHVVDVRAAMDSRGEGYGELTWEHLCRPDNFRRYRDRDVGKWGPVRG
jgi:hypothetical protein